MQENQKKLIGSPKKCPRHGSEIIIPKGEYIPICIECRNDKILARKVYDAEKALQLPERLKLCTFESYKPVNKKAESHRKTCKLFSEDHKNHGGIIMIGGVGTGKTHLAVAICQDMTKRGELCRLTTVTSLSRDIKRSWDRKRMEPGEDDEYLIIEKYSNCALLVIDEIGSQYGSDTEKIIISEIINNRYNKILPTIVLGNVTLSEATEVIGQRAIDRIKHNGKILDFDWKSYRI